jgi:predicted dehydrogenase
MQESVNRRSFLTSASSAGAVLGLAGTAMAAKKAKLVVKSTGRVIGANDTINIGVIGCGGRGTYVSRTFAKVGEGDNKCKIVAVCDVYEKRKKLNMEFHKCEGYLDFHEVINRKDVDAVIVATPDHWHATIAIEAMANGKDVYLEKPMCHTVGEAKELIDTVKATNRVLQVGSQTTSADIWHKAKKVIASGAIGDMIMSQGSYHRNSIQGEWNYSIDTGAGPDGKGDNYIDWKTYLGPAPKRAWDPERFFRFRKFWDYSGGIATDLFFHVAAPMNICWSSPQFPYKVMSGGGIYVFKDREVPDTFHLIAEYAKGHSVVLTSSMANSQHIPGLIRGHLGSIIMVEHGQFEGTASYITLKPEKRVMTPEYEGKFGKEDQKIPLDTKDAMTAHIDNFLSCVRSRQKPTLDVETAARAQVLITMAVMSYRQGRVLYFDEKNFQVLPTPPKA